MALIDRPWLRFGGVLFLLFSIAALVGCTPDNFQSTFDAKGPVARSQLILFYWIFWAAMVVWVIVGGGLIYIVIRYRRRSADDQPPQTHGHTGLEIGWTVVPSVVLAIVAVPTVGAIFYTANSPEPNAMTVEVVGHQWWWEFRYPHPTEPDAQMVTSNELHIPVDEVINIKLESKDVLHSFWIPKLAGKVDLVPNETNTMWFEAEEVGLYYGQCAEFCGVAHALMRIRVFAEPRSDFDAWLAHEASNGAEPIEPLAQEGRALFEGDARCFACHTIKGSNRSRGTVGPDLSHFSRRTTLGAGLVENSQANLRAWIEDPDNLKIGTIMRRDAAVYNDPDKALSESEVASLVAYLQTLK